MEIRKAKVEDIVTKGKTYLVRKLISERIIGKETIRSTLVRGWKRTGSLSFKVLGENIFLMDFEHHWDKARVQEGRPWVFAGQLFSGEDFDGLVPPTQMPFDSVAFWVRMYNLPLVCMGRDTGFKLGAVVGKVEEVDTNIDGVGWGEFLRVRVHVNVHKPLLRGMMLKMEDRTLWIAFQYENIQKL